MTSRSPSEVCQCLQVVESSCSQVNASIEGIGRTKGRTREDVDEIGRIAYTVAMLLIFASIIILLMYRSIKRSSSAVEMEALLDAMRIREELDLRQRQRRRLLKAKSKVSAWLTRATPSKITTTATEIQRKSTFGSVASDLPEIVVTEDLHRAHTPALSLIYDFDGSARHSVVSTAASLFSSSLDDSSSRRKSSLLQPHHTSLPS